MLRYLRISEGKLVPAQHDQAQVLVYVAPDEQERKYLIETLKLDEHTLTSSMDPDELSRLEFEPEHAALIFKRPRNYSSEDQFLFKVASIGVFLFKNFMIIVLADDAPLFEGRGFGKIASLQDVFLRMLYRSVFHFEEHLRVINMITDQLEQEVSKAMENKHLVSLFTLQKSLVYYLNAITSNLRLIDKLKIHALRLGFSTENQEFLDDLVIETTQCQEQSSVHSQVLNGLMDARVGVVNNNLNGLMKTLTLVMIFIMMPQLVVSIFSMNVKLPLPGEEVLWPFWLILGITLISVLATWLFLRFKKLS